VGESEVSVATFAAECGATEEAVRRWLGPMRIHSSARSSTELGAEAAKKCLERGGRTLAEVDAVVWCSSSDPKVGRYELRALEALGGDGQFAIHGGSTCSEMVTALWMGRTLIDDWRCARRVLVIGGEQRSSGRLVTGLAPTVRFQPVFSDLGAAALIEPGGDIQFVGLGSAADGRYWDYLELLREQPTQPTPADAVKAVADNDRITRMAFERCLSNASLKATDLSRCIFTREAPQTQTWNMHTLGLTPSLLVQVPGGPSHAGVCDTLYELESLMYGLEAPGTYVLIGNRTPGLVRFGIVQLGARSATP